jgi:hypothetical protein
MRPAFPILLAIALSGCASDSGSQVAAANSHCRQTAAHRAEEASYSGEDPDTQRAVFDKVYAECTFWQNKLDGS